MISSFESIVRRYPQRTCFTCVDKGGNETLYSYRETRMLSAALARYLRSKGVKRGSSISVDLPNCSLYVLLILAAAYGGFTLVPINNRLSDGEKLARILELERCMGTHIALRVDAAMADSLLDRTVSLFLGETRTTSHSARPSFTTHVVVATATPRSSRALGRVQAGRATRRRREEMQRQDALEEIIHFAERSAHLFDAKTRAVVMFTSGTTGKPKAVPLTWQQISSAAEASNAMLNRSGEGLWQAVLPLYHIGGFQVVVRSLLGDTPFILYARFDAQKLLKDAVQAHVTHISLVDKMLQDMLAADQGTAIKGYRCILLGGAALNSQTLAASLSAGARVFASYGMTETSSQIAHEQVTSSFDGGLRLLPGYHARVVDSDERGFGRLAVSGPGIFTGYLNAQAAHTVDGFFLTGDTAAQIAGRIYVKERTADMFVSGGENVYPAEIRDKLVRMPGVSDAHVFGVPDATWGRRPVALVERASACTQDISATHDSAKRPHQNHQASTMTQQQFAASVQKGLVPCLSKMYRPHHLCVMDKFPRTSLGKVDRVALQTCYEQRIQVVRVTLHRIRLPFTAPFKTAKETLYEREAVILEVEDHAGRIGLGECVAFPTDWYLPETLDQDVCVLREVLAPIILKEVYLHPAEVSASFATCAQAARFPLAQGALEPALWDLYGKIVGKPLWQLIGGAAPGAASLPANAQIAGKSSPLSASSAPAKQSSSTVAVSAGAVVGMGSTVDTLNAVRQCVQAGYCRVKLKVAPGGSLDIVRSVRELYPNLMITLDANQSFDERSFETLRGLDACKVAWLEEPLNPRRTPVVGPTDIFARMARLQRTMRTPLCLDESIARPDDLVRALQHPELRCFALKIGKFGGVQPALEFVRYARARGFTVWMGGMYDTGISKRFHAAFETLPGVEAPGDIGATSRYFSHDITHPPYTAERGLVTLNRAGHEYGLGCTLNRSALAEVLVERIVVQR